MICSVFLTAVEVSLKIDTVEVNEGMSVSVCVSLSNDIERDIEVMVATQTGSALGKIGIVVTSMNFPTICSTATVDFTPMEQTLMFKSSDDLCVDVFTIDDSVLEETEIFHITVSSSDPNVTLGVIPTTNIVIVDNDCKHTLLQGTGSVTFNPGI